MSSQQTIQLSLGLPEESYRSKLLGLLSGDLDFHDQVSSYASHNFHSFPAKFPPQIPQTFIQNLTNPGDIVLDPMVGSGTTVVEAYLNQRTGIGFDIDPLALRITRVKLAQPDQNTLQETGRMILQKAKENVINDTSVLEKALANHYDADSIAFLKQWFLPRIRSELFALITEIGQIEDSIARLFFEICFSGLIITKTGGVSLALDLGHTRPHLAKHVYDRNGSVLFGNTEEKSAPHHSKTYRSPFIEFEKKILQNINGLIKTDDLFRPLISCANAQTLPLKSASVDLIITSPPYASNAIDYMRAHKFSLVWFGYPVAALSKTRKKYIGGESVDTILFEDLPEFTRNIVNRVAEVDTKKGKVLHRYYSEMKRMLMEAHRVLKANRSAILVVGNSVMRDIDTRTAECLADIGKNLGFEIPRIGVRNLDRDKRMMPVGKRVNLDSQIQQRMHEEYIIGFYKPET